MKISIICDGEELLERDYKSSCDLRDCVPVVGDVINIGQYNDEIKKCGGRYSSVSKNYVVTKRLFDVVKGYNGSTNTTLYLHVDRVEGV